MQYFILISQSEGKAGYASECRSQLSGTEHRSPSCVLALIRLAEANLAPALLGFPK